jgi:cytochrome o ubiquinol oxidase subunit 2
MIMVRDDSGARAANACAGNARAGNDSVIVMHAAAHARGVALRSSPVLWRRRANSVAPRWLAAIALLSLSGCQWSVLDPQGPVGSAEKTILIDSLAIMLAIVIPTITGTLLFAWWYRGSNTRARYLPEFAYSGEIELIVWSIPILVVILLGGVAWIGSHDLDPGHPIASKTPPLDVQVVSLDWKWLFIYPAQHIATVNQLVVPAGVPLHFSLTSGSVMSVFFVPQLGSMIYTMNGMATTLNLQADRPGTYPGRSAHYNGDGFSDMYFDLRAVPADQFAAWVSATHGAGAGPMLDQASYADLARQSQHVTPFAYRNADANLFRAIVTQQVPPGPGPDTSTPKQRTSPRTEQ